MGRLLGGMAEWEISGGNERRDVCPYYKSTGRLGQTRLGLITTGIIFPVLAWTYRHCYT